MNYAVPFDGIKCNCTFSELDVIILNYLISLTLSKYLTEGTVVLKSNSIERLNFFSKLAETPGIEASVLSVETADDIGLLNAKKNGKNKSKY